MGHLPFVMYNSVVFDCKMATRHAVLSPGDDLAHDDDDLGRAKKNKKGVSNT